MCIFNVLRSMDPIDPPDTFRWLPLLKPKLNVKIPNDITPQFDDYCYSEGVVSAVDIPMLRFVTKLSHDAAAPPELRMWPPAQVS